jgi:prepilin-type N-terminal cleavage/methylation domain-containing protein/prepilin-type processing-associated H-X9-DG protein
MARIDRTIRTRPRTGPARAAGGFSLVELMVVMAIIAMLLAILVPALSSVRQAAKGLLCQTNLHANSREFQLFADSYAHDYRGASDGNSHFDALDYLRFLYRVDAFDERPNVPNESGVSSVYAANSPVVCPSGPPGLARARPGVPSASSMGLDDLRKVSYALNRRLKYAPVCFGVGGPLQWQVRLSDRVLDHPRVPLMFDVDASAFLRSPVANASQGPLLGAPEGTPSSCSIYAEDAFWFPSRRHRGKLIVSFVDGHVVATDDPLTDASWDWDYHPPL